MEFHSYGPLLPCIPDDQTVGQFVFDTAHPVRPKAKEEAPWMVEDTTGRCLSKQELRERTTALASALRYRFDIGENDVVLLFGRNHINLPVAIWAVHQLGGIISGANPDFSVNELLYQLQVTKSVLLIAGPDGLAVAEVAAKQYGLSSDRVLVFDAVGSFRTGKVSVEEMIKLGRTHAPSFTERRLKPGEGKTKVAFLCFSSGTTGRPKAVTIPHYSPIANIIQMAVHNRVHESYCAWEDRRYRPGDVAIGVLPFYHIYGLVINLHFVLFCGLSLVVVPKFNFAEMLRSIIRHRISHLILVPPMIVHMCKQSASVKESGVQDHIRMIMCGAAPLSHELNQLLFDLLPNAHIGQAYGMTELCTATTMWSIENKRGVPGGSGTLMPGVVARVIKRDGTLGGYDESGELVLHSPSRALGYLNNVDATKETFIDGWVHTGDEAKIGKDGEVWILDRIKEIMKVKGFQVAPAELEGCLLEHPDVIDACVVGVPDDYSGEVPMAFVVLTLGATKRATEDPRQITDIRKSIMKHVADNKVTYKHLAGGIEFIDAIPISPSGKILRRVLRERAKVLKEQSKAKL